MKRPFPRWNDRKMPKTWNKDLLSRIEVIHFERKMTERSAIVTHVVLATKILLQDTNETWEIDSLHMHVNNTP